MQLSAKNSNKWNTVLYVSVIKFHLFTLLLISPHISLLIICYATYKKLASQRGSNQTVLNDFQSAYVCCPGETLRIRVRVGNADDSLSISLLTSSEPQPWPGPSPGSRPPSPPSGGLSPAGRMSEAAAACHSPSAESDCCSELPSCPAPSSLSHCSRDDRLKCYIFRTKRDTW